MNTSELRQSSRGTTVVIGGGVIGLSSAWYLARDGWEVTVVDRGSVGGACSHGNCGLICPSHVLPLTEPGAFHNALKSLLTPNSPFRVQPRFDPALWSWLWNFAKRCNHACMLDAGHAIQRLLKLSMHEYQQWMENDPFESEWQEKGLLFVYQNPKALADFGKTNDFMTSEFEEPARLLDQREVVRHEPALKESVAGGWLYEHDAHLRPDKLLASLRAQLSEAGVEFMENCEFKSFSGGAGTAQCVETSQGSLRADAFVIATGAWTPHLNEQIGAKIPIQPGKGYSITMPRPEVCPIVPLIFPEHHVAVTPMMSRYRLGSIMEFAGYDSSIRPERLDLLRRAAEIYLRQPRCQPELSAWFGWRPMTYDSVPIIDFTPKWNNVLLATGHNMLGMSMAPGTGLIVSAMLANQPPPIDVAPYQIARFANKKTSRRSGHR